MKRPRRRERGDGDGCLTVILLFLILFVLDHIENVLRTIAGKLP